MRGLLGRWIALTLWIVAGDAATAAVPLYVDDDTCPAVGSGTIGSPYCRIQDAICAVRTGGGIVLVKPGTYAEAIRIFPGVSVLSTDGPDLTTIDATGRRCIDDACGADPSTTSCSAVTIRAVGGVGAGAGDRLEGFRITGGRGTIGTYPDGTRFVAGGGIFVRSSSPTITRNQIVGNQLAASGVKLFYGAGIYVHAADGSAIAAPVITRNTIADNVADPPAGTSSDRAHAFGGGIYVGYYGAPTIRENRIAGNVVGNPATANQLSAGGGLAVYSVAAAPVISQNVIASNTSALRGGAIALGTIYDSGTSSYLPSLATLDSNLVYDNSAMIGGAVSASSTRARLRSNTFYANSASDSGGAFYLEAPTSPLDQILLVNNVVAWNDADIGGGLYVAGASPTVRSEDLFGNLPTNVGGTRSDAAYLGSNGNVSVDPRFSDRAGMNLSLQSGSPLLDTGDVAEVSAVDLEGAPRVQDGNGDHAARVDLGAYEWGDLDQDGTPDGQDADRDGDAVEDEADCAPRAGGVWAVPQEVGGDLRLRRSASQAILQWSFVEQATSYQVYRGLIRHFPWTYGEICLSGGIVSGQAVDAQMPQAGQPYYYLVTAANECGESREGGTPQGADVLPRAPCAH